MDGIFCQLIIEKFLQDSTQYDGHRQSENYRSCYAHDVDVMAKGKISGYGRKNDNGQRKDKTYFLSSDLFCICHLLSLFGITVRQSYVRYSRY